MRFSKSVGTGWWQARSIALEKELAEANKRIEQLEGEVEAFWTGNIVEGASLSQVVMARAGRKRLEEMKGCIWMKSDAEVKQ